jgi:2-polyprenyl-6-methoxyphenol hydroxylase-like FAD-dependent oxidoreductase
MTNSPFLIVGGGIAGLATALGLARIGKSSHILEKAPDFDAIGAGLQLGPNAVRSLQWLGAWDAVAPHCVSPAEIHVRDGVSGNTLQRIPLGKRFEKQFGAPYRVAHRADLQNGLLESVWATPNVELQNNAEVTGISFEKTTLTLKSGKTFKGEAIIAADGVHSVVRKLMTGQIGYRPKGHTLYRSLVSTNAIPPGVDAEVITLWLYPGGHVVHYAVSNWKQFNIVAAAEDSETSPSTAFQRACKPLADLLASQDNWSARPALDLEPHQNWNENRTALIGDAAHASLPYLAQGAAMALEDACVLSGAVEKTKDIRAAFQSFSKQRFSRTRAIQNKSRELGRIYHAKGGLRLARNIVLKATPQRSFTGQFAWVYDWKAYGSDLK